MSDTMPAIFKKQKAWLLRLRGKAELRLHHTCHVCRSSAVDIYDPGAKADWKKFCNSNGPQLAAATEVASDVELGPIVSANDSKAVEAASAQPLQNPGHESTALPTAAPAKSQIQSEDDSWRTLVEQMMSVDSHHKQDVSFGTQHAPADQHQSSSSQGFVEEEVKALQAAAAVGVTHVESRVTPRAAQGSSELKRFLVEHLFGALCSVSGATVRQRVEEVQTLELRVPVYL